MCGLSGFVLVCIFQPYRFWIMVAPQVIFLMQKGLKQGDPLSPFHFVIAVDGLAGMVKKAVSNSSLSEFKVQQFAIFLFSNLRTILF